VKGRSNKIAAIATTVVIAVLMAACGGESEKETLVIAVQPSANQTELSDQASELETFLENRVDANVELRFPTSYGGVIESLRFGHADAAFMGAWPASIAADKADAEVTLAEIREVIIGDEATEEPFYYSYWVVKEDSPYQSLADLEGKAAAFPSQLSTSGYVAPMARMKELGMVTADEGESVDPGDFFGEVFFAGGYAQAWEALQAGQVDVSVIAGDVPQDLYREVLDNTRVIEEQGPIPSHAVVFSDSLEDPLRTDLKDALLELGDDEHRELMRKFVSGIFVRFEERTTEEHLGSLNAYLEETGLAFTENLR
jgi:phosphonate transport system substrate-binding protein